MTIERSPHSPATHRPRGERAPRPADRGGVASVSKAARILQSFDSRSPVQSLRQIASSTGIPRATAHGICISLVQSGFLEVVPHRGYQLGAALIGLGGRVLERSGLAEAARDASLCLPDVDGVRLHLAQLVGGWLVDLDPAGGRGPIPPNPASGARQPAHFTDAGRAALARLDPEESWAHVVAACRAAGLRPPPRDQLDADLRTIREFGFVRGDDPATGRSSVSTAIVDAALCPVGALSISAPTARFAEPATRRRILGALRTASLHVARRLAPDRG